LKRFGLCIETSFILFAASGLLALFEFWLLHGQGWQILAILVSVPALASLIFVVLGSMIPSLLATGRIKFPLNLTLPVVHTLLIVVCTRILLTTPNGAELPADGIRPIGLWLHWGVIGSVLIIEVGVLSLIAAVGRPTARGPV